MQKSKAVFWLGRLEVERMQRSLRRGRASAERSGQNWRIGDQMESANAVVLDRQLIDGAIRLCDTAFFFFERRGDQAAQQYMDRFAISLVSLIGEYFAARSRA
ncbi:hypothetical protein LHP98_18915 [Rhodobacter sp. Har01]|uniref:hypothetical protein n=1 Tax=Rhodobacter sp. Har01 TaxID=2883999 RepID=UPI001D05F485|nr:hypothetical protein [Rhodobacter sp. Har01]MCB6180190.1 hypothetical protein [Rhodobacter sp. Har01]